MAAPREFPLNWDLDRLLPRPESEAFRAEFAALKAALAGLAETSEQLPPCSGDADVSASWQEFLLQYERWDSRATDLRAHVDCHLAANAQSEAYRALDGEFSALTPVRERIAVNLEFALQQAGADDVEALCRSTPWIESIRYYLETRRKQALLRLPREQEQLASELAVDGLHAWGRLYDHLSSAIRIRVMERGQIVEKSPGQVYFDSPQRAVRENNFFAADVAWRSIAEPCAAAINHIAGSRLTAYRRLNRHHLDVPLQFNRMRRETLDAMWSAISARKQELLPYLERKAALLGVPKLAFWDQVAPLSLTGPNNPDVLPYADACREILEAFHRFSPEFGRFAEMALKEGWVEAEDRAGKRQGGFCTTYPTAKQSRIFMTYTDSSDNMFTLAHELGHAYHSWVLRDQPWFLADYPMNLAETASTFAEAVLADRRYALAEDRNEKLAMLDGLLSDSVAFLMNIHARFLFEDELYTRRKSGELTVDELNELMLKAQQSAYLNSLADDGWNPRFWISKLHFYITGWPFYNFPYTFGYLLSQGLYAIGRSSPAEFPSRYQKFLAATGSMDAEDAVRRCFGDDLSRPDFWNRSLDLVKDRVAKYLELSAPLISI